MRGGRELGCEWAGVWRVLGAAGASLGVLLLQSVVQEVLGPSHCG